MAGSSCDASFHCAGVGQSFCDSWFPVSVRGFCVPIRTRNVAFDEHGSRKLMLGHLHDRRSKPAVLCLWLARDGAGVPIVVWGRFFRGLNGGRSLATTKGNGPLVAPRLHHGHARRVGWQVAPWGWGTMSVSSRVTKDQEQLEAERHAESMSTIAWLEALPSTTIPDVVATQRARATEELAQIDLHRARRKSTKSQP
jgi:hypothetical protein